jgi:hypothetical protein
LGRASIGNQIIKDEKINSVSKIWGNINAVEFLGNARKTRCLWKYNWEINYCTIKELFDYKLKRRILWKNLF